MGNYQRRYEKMLHTNRTYNSVDPDGLPPEFRSSTVFLEEGVAFIRRRLWIILLTWFVTIGAALLYLIAAVPTFTAKAQLFLDSRAAAVDASSVSTIVESQIAIIKSESIARAVIEKLGLAKRPEFATQDSVLRAITKSISQRLGWSKPDRDSSAMRYAMESLAQNLSAKRVGPTYIVEMTYEAADPDRAAQILNAVAEKYIMRQMDAKFNSSVRDETWAKDRLNELSAQASAAQKALEDYYKNKAASADTDDDLVAAAESAKNAYDNFRHMLRKMEATQQRSAPAFEASLVTVASPPLRATSPKPRMVLGIGAVAGVLLGIALGMLRDLLDRGFRVSGQEPRLSAQGDGIERSVPDAIRPDHLPETSATARPVRLTGSR